MSELNSARICAGSLSVSSSRDELINGGRNWKLAFLKIRGRCGGTTAVTTAALLEMPFRVAADGQLTVIFLVMEASYNCTGKASGPDSVRSPILLSG